MNSKQLNLYTIGHSNHSFERFVELLRGHQVDVLVDVRSQPWSRYSPHFNREQLQPELEALGFRYLFMGDQLGGRPEAEKYYDAAGHVLYYKVARADWFLQGVQRLVTGIQDYRVAIMCSEEDPGICHRFLLVTRVLSEQGIQIQHIRGDGRLQSEEAVCNHSRDQRHQGVLFQELEDDTWKSLQSVLPKAAPNDSLVD